MAQHPRSRRISYCIIITAKNKGSVTFVVARCGEAFWAPSSEAPLVSSSRKQFASASGYARCYHPLKMRGN